jgi:hypothetical protein
MFSPCETCAIRKKSLLVQQLQELFPQQQMHSRCVAGILSLFQYEAKAWWLRFSTCRVSLHVFLLDCCCIFTCGDLHDSCKLAPVCGLLAQPRARCCSSCRSCSRSSRCTQGMGPAFHADPYLLQKYTEAL